MQGNIEKRRAKRDDEAEEYGEGSCDPNGAGEARGPTLLLPRNSRQSSSILNVHIYNIKSRRTKSKAILLLHQYHSLCLQPKNTSEPIS